MIIEIKTARGWQIWIDGVCPTCEWSIGDPPEEITPDYRGETFYRYETTQQAVVGDPMPWPPLQIAGRSMEWIAFDIPQHQWETGIDGTKIVATEAFVKFEGEDAIYMSVTEVHWLGDDIGVAPKGVQLENGEWLKIDEVTTYVRLETEAQP